MDDDYYTYVEDQYMLLGERTRKIYRLGDAVSIIVTKVSHEERNIDFRFTGETVESRPLGEKTKSYAGKEGRRPRERSEAAGDSKHRTAGSKPKTGAGRGRTGSGTAKPGAAKPGTGNARASKPRTGVAKGKPTGRPSAKKR
jgi:ribonuclease R